MSEIIEFPGNFKKERMPEEDSEQGGSNNIIQYNFGERVGERGISGRRYTTIGVNPEKMIRATEQLATIQKYLNSLHGNASNETIARRQEIAKQYSNEELVDHILNSSEIEWQEKPSFYSAILREFAGRMREILS
ncbi:MAG: hypothetical protein WCI52_03845 [bacterium]